MYDHWVADLASTADYYPGGMMMPGRNTEYSWSRMGYNGKLKDDEVYGKGNFQDYGARMLDNRLLRFFSVDPLASKFASFAPYSYAFNNPICFIDEDGLYGKASKQEFYEKMGTAALKSLNNIDIKHQANPYKALYMVAQYRQENSTDINPPGNNPFNIKGQGDDGKLSYMTHENLNGKNQFLKQSFAKFSSIDKGFEGYIQLLNKNFNGAYSALTDNEKSIDDFAYGLQHGRLGAYATDPNYAQNLKKMLTSVVNDYEQAITTQMQAVNNKLEAKRGELKSIMTNEKLGFVEKALQMQSTSAEIKSLENEKSDVQTKSSQLEEFKKSEGL